MELNNIEDGVVARLVELLVGQYQDIESTLPLLSRELSHSERKALKIVSGAGRISIGEIGKSLQSPPSTTTWLVGGMVKRGIFKREQDEKDKRKVWIELTDKGEALARLMERIPDRIASDLLYKLEPGQRDTFIELVGVAMSRMEKAVRGK